MTDITERRRMETENQVLANIIKHSQDFIGVADMDQSAFFVNPAGQAMVGLDGDEAVRRTSITDYYFDEDLPFVGQTILPTLFSKGRWNGEFRLRHFKTGEPIPILYDLFLTENPETGNPTNITTISRNITELKKAEESLKHSERTYREIFDSFTDALFIHDIDTGAILDVNDSMLTKFGYKREELSDLTVERLSALMEPYTSKHAKELIKRAAGGETVVFEWLNRKKNGELFYSENILKFVVIAGTERIIAIARDITERKQAEKALKDERDQLLSLFNSLDEVIYIADPQTHELLYINRYLADLLPENCIGKKCYRILQGLDTPCSFCTNDIIFEKKPEPHRWEYYNPFLKRHFAIVDRVIRWSDGRDVRFEMAVDISAIKQSEEVLSASERRFRDILQDMTTVAVQSYNMDGTVHYWNRASETFYGYTAQEAFGRNLLDLIIPPEMRDEVRAAIRRMAETREAIPSSELLLMRKDGSLIPVYSSHALVQIPGQDAELYCIDIDLSDRLQAEAEKEKLQTHLLQAQKMESVGRLAGGVAHDFNNMLGVILGHVELAMEKVEKKHRLYSDLIEIKTAAQRSADLTRQLLTFARKQTISPKQLNLNDTVESMLKMLRRLIGEDIDLIWQPAAHLWPVKMDSSQIDQVLVNLCVNARDAISGVGRLTIETGRQNFDEEFCNQHSGFIPGDYVLLTVSDNGCGMNKETLDNLFEPFFTTKEMGKGTGLGLATVYGIIKQNNGFINVYSEPGQGSTFKIYLPRLITDDDTDMTAPEKKAPAGGTETILLVEDEPAILRMTRMMLERKGYNVLSAATPTEAMGKAKNHPGTIDLLMTDVVMPEMNGRDLAEKLSALYPDINILFMSGYSANVIAHQGVLDEGVAFIQKPFSMADLAEKVREVLDIASD
jgi:PAS domain S-box-containing protein